MNTNVSPCLCVGELLGDVQKGRDAQRFITECVFMCVFVCDRTCVSDVLL